MEFVTAGVKRSVIHETPSIIIIIFSKDSEFVYFIDVEELTQELGCVHKPEEWRLLLHLSKFS
jgi:hypothetical protein